MFDCNNNSKERVEAKSIKRVKKLKNRGKIIRNLLESSATRGALILRLLVY